MMEIKEHRIKLLENTIKKDKETLRLDQRHLEFKKMRNEENEIILKHYYKLIRELNKDKEREDYKKTECRKCELGKYGDCMAEIDDVLECKQFQERLDKEM